MNPDEWFDPYLPRRESPARPALPPAAARRPTSPSLTTTAASPTRPACVGVGSAAGEAGDDVPQLHGHAEEMHSTRGRTHLLFEMLQGDPMTGGGRPGRSRRPSTSAWPARVAGECPMNVDMATYKAEFLSHYYEGRPAPPRLRDGLDRLVGALPRSRRAREPGHACACLGSSPGSWAGSRRAGDAPVRRRDVQGVVGRRPPARTATWPEGLLWADTFNNYFHPQTAIAAVEVLETAGSG